MIAGHNALLLGLTTALLLRLLPLLSDPAIVGSGLATIALLFQRVRAAGIEARPVLLLSLFGRVIFRQGFDRQLQDQPNLQVHFD